MRHFITVNDIGNLQEALQKAKYVKENPYADCNLGKK